MVRKCLDLFCGLGGFSQAFEEDPEWEVTTLDIEEEFDPDICTDILNMTHEDFDDYEIVLASPPCEGFSIADHRNTWTEDGRPPSKKSRDGIMIAYHTLGLCKALDPDYWFMENPTGMLRSVIGDPKARVTLCQYGEEWMKPTDLWGRHPDAFEYRSCSRGQDCHESTHPGSVSGVAGTRDPAKRAFLPYGLSEEVKESIDRKPSSAVDW